MTLWFWLFFIYNMCMLYYVLLDALYLCMCDKEGSFGTCLSLRGLSATNYLLAQLTKM